MKNRYITRQEELVFEIQSLAHSININGGCVILENAGHTNQLSVTICKDKENYGFITHQALFLYYGGGYVSSIEEFEAVIDRLKIELERWV